MKNGKLKRRLIAFGLSIVALVFLVSLFGDLGLGMTIILAMILYENL